MATKYSNDFFIMFLFGVMKINSRSDILNIYTIDPCLDFKLTAKSIISE